MNRLKIKILMATVGIFAASFTANAQTITFKINLRPQLEDSIFIPGEDQIYLKGNIFPLSQSRRVYLKDLAPVDSIYQATVNFSSSAVGEKLSYNFYIETPEKIKKEETSRYVRLTSENKELDALYFNSFTW